MDIKGGRISLTINGRTFTSRSAAKVDPSTVATATGANQNGTGFVTVAAKLAMIEASFDRGKGLKWDAKMMLETLDVTFKEDDTGVTHLFTAANWDGFPQIDTATGEVTGLKIATDKYQQL